MFLSLLAALSGARAADLAAGGGAEVVAGVVHPPGAWTGAWSGAAGGQVEGALRVDGALSFDAALDVRFSLEPAVVGVLPEALVVRGEVGPVWLGAGIAPGPWRVEPVDGWDTLLVTWSAEQRHVLPNSLAAVEVGLGSPDRGVVFLGGLDLGAGWNLLGDAGGQFVRAPLLAGVHGRVGGEGVRLNGGVYTRPDTPSVTGQAGAEMDFDELRLEVQVVGGWNAAFGAHVEAALFPEGVATPVGRAELLGGQVGGAVGVAVRPAAWLDLKAEIAYADGAPQGWIGVAAWGETRAKDRKRGR